MATTPFSETLATLLADRGRSTGWMLLVTALVLIAWGYWAVRAPVTLYEVSASARVEVDGATYPLESPLPGRVVSVNLRVGQPVRKGDVLVEIDSTADRLHLRQEEIRANGLAPEITRLRSQITAEEQARLQEHRASASSAQVAAGRIREADTESRYAEGEVARMEALFQHGLVPSRDLEKSRADARRLGDRGATLEAAARGVPQEQATRDRERDVRIEALHAQIAALQAQGGTVTAGIERLAHEMERRTVRAPVDGVVGEAIALRPGVVVREAERLGAVMPEGRLLITAQFPADAAFGRIRAGQPATLRLAGFPWAEFGTVSATVARVSREIRNGSVRVDLTIEPGPSFRGELEHGMPGAVEIAVDHATPMALVLRALGQGLTVRR